MEEEEEEEGSEEMELPWILEMNIREILGDSK